MAKTNPGECPFGETVFLDECGDHSFDLDDALFIHGETIAEYKLVRWGYLNSKPRLEKTRPKT